MDFDEYINSALRGFRKTKDYFYNKQVLLELYETTYGICNHLETKNPLAAVSFNDSEKYLNNYLYENYLYTYKQKNISMLMTFDEYINRPRYDIESINRVMDRLNAKKLEVEGDALSELQSSTKADKKKT